MRILRRQRHAAREFGRFYAGRRASRTARRVCHVSGHLALDLALIGGPQVRPALAGQPLGLGVAPGGDLAVIAGDEHLRDRPALPHLRPGVLRVFQQAVGEALLGAGGLRAHDAGHQPHAGIDQRHGGDLAAGQHVIADRDLFESARLDHPLVDALEAAADHDGAGAVRQRLDAGLRQRRAARATSAGEGAPSLRRGIERAGEHVGLHHHAGAAAGRRVVDGAVLVGREARGCRRRRATTGRRRAPCRRGSGRAVPETCPGRS